MVKYLTAIHLYDPKNPLSDVWSMKYDLVVVGAGPAGYVSSTINIELPETFGIESKVTRMRTDKK